MKTIRLKRIISIFLSVLMLLTTFECVMPVIAEDGKGQDSAIEETESKATEIIAEDESQRTEFSKTYAMSDGSMRSDFYSAPIHYQTRDGVWKEKNSFRDGALRGSPQTASSGILATYVVSSSPNTSYSAETNVLLGSGKIGLIDTGNFSELNGSFVVTLAELNMPITAGSSPTIYAYAITESWDYETVTYSNCPAYSTDVLDYSVSGDSLIIDVTKYYNEATFYGVALICSSSVTISKSSSSPVFTTTYIVGAGMDDDFEYIDFDMGTAGQVHINIESGNLVIIDDGLSTGDDEEAIDFNSVYNSSSSVLSEGIWATSLDSAFILSKNLFLDETGKLQILKTKPGPDAEGYYEFEENEYGFRKIKILEHTFIIAKKFEVLTDQENLKYIYTTSGLESIEDTAENRFIFKKTDEGNGSYKLTDGNGNYIRYISNDSGRFFTTYSADNTVGNSLNYTYTFNSNSIDVVKSLNGVNQASYNSDEHFRISRIEDNEGHRLLVTYNSVSRKVTSVSESRLVGNEYITTKTLSFDRTLNTCKVKDFGNDLLENTSDDIITTYSFDNACRLICTQAETLSEKLGSVSYKYDENGELERSASSGRISDNLLKNHNIESMSNWTAKKVDDNNCSGDSTYSTNESFVGNGSLMINVTDVTTTGGQSAYQAFNVTGSSLIKRSTTYSASVYVKTNGIIRDNDANIDKNVGASIMVRVAKEDGSATKQYSESITDTNGDWERINVKFDTPSDCSRVTIYLIVRNGTGTAFFDAAQLEEGKTPNEYNLVENNSFDYTTNWSRNNLVTADAISGGQYLINGDINTEKFIHQDINLNGASQDDTYILSAVANADAASPSHSTFGIIARLFYSDGTDDVYSPLVTFCSYNSSSQYIQASFNLSTESTDAAPVKIRLCFLYYNNINQAALETISLIKSSNIYDVSPEDEGTYTYNAAGDIATYTDPDGNITTYTYSTTISGKTYLSRTETVDTENNIIEYVNYNEDGKIISQLSEGNITTYTYSNGNLTRLETKNSSNETIYLSFYDSDEDITSETDEDGNVTTYTYTGSGENKYLSRSETKNSSNVIIAYSNFNSSGNVTSQLSEGIVSSYTYDNDGNVLTETVDGTTTTYTYNSEGKVATKTKSGHTITYGYSGDKLSSVSTGTATYNYAFDAWNRNTSISIGTQPLESHTYNADGTLAQTTYGSGDTEQYTYNAYGQLSKVKHSGSTVFGFYTDSQGYLIFENDNINSHRTYYKYDDQGRKIGEHVVSIASSNAYDNDMYWQKSDYNENGELSSNTVKSRNGSVSSTYTYSDILTGGSQTVSSVLNGRQVTNIYDSEGNIISKSYNTDTNYSQSYTYNDKGNIATENSGGDIFTYTYDNYDRITEIRKNNTLRQSYVYDTLGQLTRENNLDTNKTTLYTYDNSGNITQKTEHAYTTGIPGTATNTVNYSYGNSAWGDELTSYDGETISYDAIGNPTTYRDATCTFFGNQLQSYSKNSTTISYKYDSDGLRTKKTVGNTNHDYYYVDGVVLYEKVGNEYEVFYQYDADGRLSFLIYVTLSTGTKNCYSVVTNAQGDVVKLLDGQGNGVVSYAYDAWGNITLIMDSTSINIGSKNSIRYRGYVYDTETGLYYLQSRYYDPQTGRFISSDQPEYIGANDDFGGWNSFSYCENECVNRYDPTGSKYDEKTTKYNSNKALTYAEKWWDRRNPEYYIYSDKGGDCANFVSQCIYAGGMKMDSEWYSYSSNYAHNGWYSQIRGIKLSGTFNGFVMLPAYMWFNVSKAWSLAKKLCKYLTTKYEYVKIEKNNTNKLKKYIRNKTIKLGDPAFFVKGNKADINNAQHSTIIGDIKNGDCFYYAHTGNRNAKRESKKDNGVGLRSVLKNESIVVIRMDRKR